MSTRRAASASLRPGLCGLLTALAAACSAGGSRSSTPPVAPAPTSAPMVAPAQELEPLTGRADVVPSKPRQLPTTILQAARGILLVSDTPDASAALVRRVDGRGAVGPAIALPGEHVAEVLAATDEAFTLVSTSGPSLCLATYREGSATPEGRGCAAVSPDVVALVGDKVALIETREVPRAKPKPAASKPAAKPKKGGKAPAKRKVTTKKSSSKSASRRAPAATLRPAPSFDVLVRWASRDGQIDAQAEPTGVRFQRALGGMTILGAAGRGEGLDLVYYESAPAKARDNGKLGRARLVRVSLDGEGKLVEGSRRTLYEGPLDYAGLGEHRGARLFSSSAGTILVERDKGDCRAISIVSGAALPTSELACRLAPMSLGDGALSPSAIAALERIAAEEPSRAPGQPSTDLGRVGWAGDRAYYLQGGTLRSASRDDGVAREEPALMRAARARVAWGAVAADGAGLAMVDGALHAWGATGEAVALPLGPLASVAALRHADDAPGGGAAPTRVGGAWLLARGGDVLRLAPDPAILEELRGRALDDVTALVGGDRGGLFVELRDGWLGATPLGEAEPVPGVAAPRVPSPVRSGFRAVPRRGGGAVLAGVSSSSPKSVVAFAIDAGGRVGRAFETSLAIEPGDLGVTLSPLPDGGALLSSPAREEIVWLDDDGHELAKAAWPNGAVEASCVDGAPARLDLPSTVPGELVRVPELAHPGTCLLGEPTWASDGTLRWLGSRALGFDARVEIGEAHAPTTVGVQAGASVAPFEPAPSSASAAPAPICPPDMVAIAGAYCVDRYEGMLVDVATGARVSPDYPTTPGLYDYALSGWATERERAGDVRAHALPLPLPLTATQPTPRAVSRVGVRPNAYLSGDVAEAACEASGKRLCSRDEFVRACRGEADTDFPYGPDYRYGVCNVDRPEHPAATLHGNASLGHLDPRLGHVVASDGPLLRLTGATPACRSEWGDDAIYDMVGNLDEWVADPDGFAGGFYSRSARNGCDALVSTHPKRYLDYSIGVRCCKDAAAGDEP